MDGDRQMAKLSNEQDVVVFMTAYYIDWKTRKFPTLKKKRKMAEMLVNNRMSVVVANNLIDTKKGRIKYSTSFDSYKQTTNFHFDTVNEDDNVDNYEDEIGQLSWIFSLVHSMELLLDKDLFNFSFFANMERFLVSVDSRLLQVDPVVYCLNGIIFINFELIDYNSTTPLNKDDILGRLNNYNLVSVEGVQYFNEDEPVPDTRKIPDIIFDNLTEFLYQLIGRKLTSDSVSFAHNIFVLSNNIDSEIGDYFLNVLGVTDVELEIKNLNTNDVHKYFSQEFLGVTTDVATGCEHETLFHCQLLEALKMYFFIRQYADFISINDLEKTLDCKMHLEFLATAGRLPIITLNAINNMKNTHSYKKNEDMLNVKLSFLNLAQERRKSRNATLLNILLYLLTFIGGIGALEVLYNQFYWDFMIMTVILAVIFIGFGGYWAWKEWKCR